MVKTAQKPAHEFRLAGSFFEETTVYRLREACLKLAGRLGDKKPTIEYDEEGDSAYMTVKDGTVYIVSFDDDEAPDVITITTCFG